MQYKKEHLNIKAGTLSCICSLEGEIVPDDTDIPTYPLLSPPTSSNFNVMTEVDELLGTATDTASSIVPIISEEIKLKENTKRFHRIMHDRLRKGKRVPGNMLFRSIGGLEQIFVPQSLVARLLR